jgi:DNA-binding transcriptional MerR regulator
MLDLTKSTLRFWEKELEGIIVPLRTDGGQRRYTPKHLFIIEEIKRLKDKGLSLTTIRNRLETTDHPILGTNTNPDKIDLLADHVAEKVRSAIYRFFQEEEIQEET